MSPVWALLQRVADKYGSKPSRLPDLDAQRTADIALLCAMLKSFEGLRLSAYKDDGHGIPTIGYGATRTLGNRPVKMGDRITVEKAEKLLVRDAGVAYDSAVKMLREDASRGARCAFSSLVFNIGARKVRRSEALRKYNAGWLNSAKKEYYEFRLANGKVLPGLVKRRRKEWELVEGDEG